MRKNKNNSRCKQPTLDSSLFKNTVPYFGGRYLKNSNPRTKRPITTKNSIHLVLRSSLAKYEYSFLNYKHRAKVERILRKQAEVFRIKVYKLSINACHIHLLIKLYTLDSYKMFIRAVTGLIATTVMGVEKGNGKYLKFWDSRPFTRIVAWAGAYNVAKGYVLQNIKEACGAVAYTERNKSPA